MENKDLNEILNGSDKTIDDLLNARDSDDYIESIRNDLNNIFSSDEPNKSDYTDINLDNTDLEEIVEDQPDTLKDVVLDPIEEVVEDIPEKADEIKEEIDSMADQVVDDLSSKIEKDGEDLKISDTTDLPKEESKEVKSDTTPIFFSTDLDDDPKVDTEIKPELPDEKEVKPVEDVIPEDKPEPVEPSLEDTQDFTPIVEPEDKPEAESDVEPAEMEKTIVAPVVKNVAEKPVETSEQDDLEKEVFAKDNVNANYLVNLIKGMTSAMTLGEIIKDFNVKDFFVLDDEDRILADNSVIVDDADISDAIVSDAKMFGNKIGLILDTEEEEEEVDDAGFLKVLRGVGIALIILALLGLLVYFGLKWFNNRSKPEPTPVDTRIASLADEEDLYFNMNVDDGIQYDPSGSIDLKTLLDENKYKGYTITVTPENIDQSIVGDYEVKYDITDSENKDNAKSYTTNILVVDREKPQIDIDIDTINVTTSDRFNLEESLANLKVSDPRDGEFKLVDEAPEKREREGDKGPVYESGWYVISSNVKSGVAGNYTINIHAEDVNGNSIEKSIPVVIKANNTSVNTNPNPTPNPTPQPSRKCQYKVVDEPATPEQCVITVPGRDAYDEQVWVVDVPAKPAETTQVWVVDSPATEDTPERGHWESVVVTPAQPAQGHYETVHHDAVEEVKQCTPATPEKSHIEERDC